MTLHDVPGSDPDPARDRRRGAAYPRVVAAADAVVVSDGREERDVAAWSGRRSTVGPLPGGPLEAPGPTPAWAGRPSVGVGGFGYFPAYTLGAVAAAQLFRAACAGEPDLLPGIARGDFAPMMVWLNRNVHGQGCLHGSADDLLARATGRPLQVDDFLAHLEARYGG